MEIEKTTKEPTTATKTDDNFIPILLNPIKPPDRKKVTPLPKVDDSESIILGHEIMPGDTVEIYSNPETQDGEVSYGIAVECLKVELPFILVDEPHYRQQLYRLEKWKVYLIEENQEVIVKLRTLVTRGLKSSYSLYEEERVRKIYLSDNFTAFNGIEVF